MSWYFGDPCYVIRDDDWMDFCDLLHAADIKDDCPNPVCITWRGVPLEVWSCGGDGCWSFDFNSEGPEHGSSFGVDAGIFCAMPASILDVPLEDITGGRIEAMIFRDEPQCLVEDGVVFLNGTHDDSSMACDICNRWCNAWSMQSCGCGYSFCYNCECRCGW